jgi:NAD+ kinase
VLGVNVGRVGFLTEIEPPEIEAALDAFRRDAAHIDERLMLTMSASRPLEIPPNIQALLRYGRGPLLPPPPLRPAAEPGAPGVCLDVTAMNDIVFEKLARDRQASLGLYIDDVLFASYSADALIVASPTGSTAYSFAAGGPVLSPRMRVAIRVLEQSGQVAVSVDGQLRGVLDPGDWISVYRAESTAKLVRIRPSNFYSRLRSRFSLTDAPATITESAVQVSRERMPL